MLRLKEFFDKMADTWDERVYHDPKKLKLFFACIDLKPGARVLDVGTGTGILIPYIHKEIGQEGIIHAVDLSSKMLEKAMAKYPYPNVEYIQGDIMDVPLKDQYYDCILCYSVFPHFIDQQKAISHLSAKLKSGGKLVIAHSQSRNFINNMHRNAGDEVKQDILPPMADIEIMMKNSKLKVVESIDNDEMFLIIGQK